MSTEPFRIPCPSCGKNLKTASEPAAGSRLKCPKCQTEFRYQRTGAAEAPQPSPRPVVTVQPSAVVQPAASQPKKGGGAGFALAMVLLLGLLVCVAAGGGIIVYRALQSDKPQVAQGGSGEPGDDDDGVNDNSGEGGGEDDPQQDGPAGAIPDEFEGDDEETDDSDATDEPADEGGEEADLGMDEEPQVDGVSTEPLDGRPKQFASAAQGNLLLPPVEYPAGIVDVEFSPKGDKLAAIDGAGFATIWNVKSKRGTNVTFPSLGGSIGGGVVDMTQIRFMSDGKFLVFGTTNSVVVADVASGKSKWTTEAVFQAGRLIVSGNGRSVLVNPVDLYSGASEGADVFDTATGKKLAERLEIAYYDQLAFSHDGRLLALVEADRVRLFDVKQKRDAKVIRGVSANYLAFSPDAKTMVVSSDEIQIWDLSGDEPSLSGNIEFSELSGGTGSGRLTISPDGKSLAIGSNLFDLPNGRKRAQVEGLIEGDFSGDSRFMAGLTTKRGDEQNIVVADAATGRIVEVFDMGMLDESFYRDALCVALSPDGQLVAVGSGDGSITLHAVAEKAAGGGELASFKLEVPDHLLGQFDSRKPTLAFDLGFSPDGERVVTRGTWTTVWDIEGGAQQVLMPAPDERQASPATFGFGPGEAEPVRATSWMFRQSDNALVVSNGNLLNHYQPTLGTPEVNKDDSTEYALVKRSPNGNRVAAILSERGPNRDQNELVLLEPQNGKVQTSVWLTDLTGNLRQIELFERLNFSNDGKLLALVTGSSEVKVFETAPVRERPTTAQSATAVAFLQKGRSLVTTEGQYGLNAAHVYDIGTGQLKYDLDLSRGHTGAIGAAAFSDLAPVFASGDADGTLLIRDPKTGDVKARVDAHGAPIIAAGFSADGTRLATAAQDFTVKVWDVSKLLGAGGGQGGQ